MTIFQCPACTAQMILPPGPLPVMLACPSCHGAAPPHAWAKLAQRAQVQVLQYPACSRGTYIVLGLFLGGLGIHNFVAGRLLCGMFQLLITLVGAWFCFPVAIVVIWVIIELIVVTHDGRGVRM